MANNKISLFFKSLLLGIFIFGFGVNGHAATLPAGYTELEYIESTGTQYIDTGVKIASTDTVETEFNNSTSTDYGAVYGIYATGESSAFYANGTYYGYDASNSKVNTNVVVDNQWHTVVHDFVNGTLQLDDTIVTFTPFEFANTTNNGLFTRFYDGSYGYFFKGSVKSHKITRNGVVILDMVSAKRNSDNALGMYDTVSGTFFTNAGTGEFIAGPAVVTNSGPISSVTVAGLVAQNGTPTPTTPIDIVSNNGVLKVSGNLLNPNDPDYGNYTVNIDGTYNYANDRITTGFIPVIGGNTLTVSTNINVGSINGFQFAGIAEYDANKQYITRTYGNAQPTLSVNLNSNTSYVRVFEQFTGLSNVTPALFATYQQQLELGSTATAYRPYGEIYTDGEVETIGDSANHTATVATLLGVGDYRDTQNINTGAITRNVGVLVLDGTELWRKIERENAEEYRLNINNKAKGISFSNYFSGVYKNRLELYDFELGMFNLTNETTNIVIRYDAKTSVEAFQQWLADQYAAGTPVIIVYPLETPTTESVAGQTMTTAPVNNRTGGVTGMTITTLLSSGASVVTTIAANAIKIATSAYNSARFSPVVTELNNTIATIRSVVTNTINQTKAIADLQATKQTRPDENCPAGKKCLLVEDDAGQPHWYEIIENAYGLPNGYTALEYIESTGTQYIDTGITGFNTGNWEIYAKWLLPVATQTNSYANVFSVYSSENHNSYRIITKLTDSSAYYISGNSKAGGGSALLDNKAINQIHTATARNGSVIFDGETINTPTQGTALPSNVNLGIFARGDGSSKIVARIYSVNVKKDGVLIGDFVPAKNSSGVVGMYDTVSGQFFTNAGSGTFTAGPEI